MRALEVLLLCSAVSLRGASCFRSLRAAEAQQRHSVLGVGAAGHTAGYFGACSVRVGIGYDIHRVVDSRTGGKRLRLGGVWIPDDSVQVVAHSDGDVVLHSVSDAILGALGRGDIGDYFPDSSPEFRDCDSELILARALDLMGNLGFALVNVDVCIVLEAPKLGPLKSEIRDNLVRLLGQGVLVNVKAKTNEKLDAVGSGSAIACNSVVLLQNRY